MVVVAGCWREPSAISLWPQEEESHQMTTKRQSSCVHTHCKWWKNRDIFLTFDAAFGVFVEEDFQLKMHVRE